MSRIVHGIANLTYRASGDYGRDNVFFIESMGENLPCAEYLVERTRAKTDTKSIYVMEYVLGGKGYIECAGKEFTVKKGDFYFLNRLHSHLYYSDREDPYSKIWVNVRGKLLDGIVNAYGLTDGAIVVHESQTLVYFEKVRSLLSTVNVDNSDEIMTECSKVICEMLITAAAEHRKVQRATISTAERIKDYIDSGLSYNVTLDDIAQHFYLNKSYIISIFSEKYGHTPKQYILQRKMQSACSMLEENLYSIAEIADILDFSSSQHFSSSFKKKIGMSPDEYRRSKSE